MIRNQQSVQRSAAEVVGVEAVLITADQLAVWLQVSKRSLWRLRSAGQLPAPVKLRSAVRWRLSDIEAWLAQGCPPDFGKTSG